MAINGVTSFSSYHVCSGSGIDAEWERIQRRLKEYGIKSSGSKATDMSKLRDIEMREVKTLTTPSSKFLTITKSEQEKIIEQKNSHKVNKQLKKEEKDEYNSEKYQNTQKAINTLGEQIYLVIKMKKKNS